MKRMTFLTVIVLMFGMIGFTQAQAMQPVCGDLAAEDCAILEQNAQAMMEASSYAFDMNANFVINNIPDMPSDVSFGITGEGAFTADDLSSLQMSPDAMMSLMSDPEAYAEFVSTALGALDMELSLVLTLPEALVAESNGQVPSSLPLEVVLVDGTGYLNFSSLREAVGEAGASFPVGWYGIDLVGLVNEAMAMTGGMGMMPMGDMDMSTFEQFADPAFLNQFMTVERVADTTAADGTAVAAFVTTIDYAALFSDPAFMDLVIASAEAQGATLSEDELAEMSAILPQMFQGMTATVTQTIGLEDFYSRSMQMTFNLDMQSMMAVAAEMGDNVDMEGPAPMIMFDLNMNLMDFNAVPEITAPEGATVIPLESLGMGMSSGMDANATTVEPMMPTATPSK